ncbi:MAG: translation initiation factor [Bacteroidetes bacterium]|nr:translation initiation factor [Bacteroidota bacterium]
MAKLTSLSDLAVLLGNDASGAQSSAPNQKTGYNGKPQILKVVLDSKKRRGKTVTVISGFQSNPKELESIAQTLKKTCGTGGQVLDNTIEIQGDHRQKAIDKLKAMGFTIK